MQPMGACIERMVSGSSVSISFTSARVSGSLAGAVPGERTVSRDASSTERDGTAPAFQLDVAKLRFRSTPFALPRVPSDTPSGFAHSTKATLLKLCEKARRERLKRNVVSGSSPWMAATTSRRQRPVHGM